MSNTNMSHFIGNPLGALPTFRNALDNEPLTPEDTATLIEAIASEEMETGLADFDSDEDDSNEKVYTFSYGDRLSFHTANYVIHEYFKVKSSDSITVQDKFTWEYEYDLDKFQPLLAIGSKVYTLKDNSKLIIMSPNLEGCSIMLAGNFNLMPIVEEIKDAIKNKNPLRNKNIQLVPGPQGYEVLFKPVPTTTFDEVILDQAMKDDIYDNTIFQLKHIDSNNGIILSGQPGCQPAGSKVLMGNGKWKNIEDIQVGEFVMSPQLDGSVIPVKTIDSLVYENRDIYKVASKGVRQSISYRCSGNHILPLNVLKWTSRAGGIKRKHITKLEEMTVEEFISKSKTYKEKARLFTSPPIELPEKEFKIHPYLLGVYIGDGCLGKYRVTPTSSRFKNPVLTNPSLEIVQRMRDNGADLGNSYLRENIYSTTLRGKTAEDFKELSVWGKLSHFKFIPEEYKTGSLQQRLELLAGLIDTDGTAAEYSSVSLQLAEDFKELIFSVGGYATLRERYTTCNGEKFKSYRVLYSIGEHVIPTTLGYKRNKARDFKWKDHRNHNLEVTKEGVETVYGFTLKGGSQWYITDNWIVTHNTGKSKTCQAIIGEAIKEGYSTCFVVQKVDWSMLDEFIREFLAPAIVILEDIDAFCQSREETLNGDLASFLQFVNGLSEHKEKLVFVCTTNHLDHLDKAVANRPMRFNRKFEFKYPTDDQIDRLLELYFKDVNLSRAQKRLCYNCEFSGSHIKELWRTATLLSKKQNKTLAEVFEKAVETVGSNFSTTLTGKMGFNS